MRWNSGKMKNVERPDVDKFIEAVILVCREHGLSLGHEDDHGSFEIGKFDEEKVKWLREANVSDL